MQKAVIIKLAIKKRHARQKADYPSLKREKLVKWRWKNASIPTEMMLAAETISSRKTHKSFSGRFFETIYLGIFHGLDLTT